jgi:hypothetical protein
MGWSWGGALSGGLAGLSTGNPWLAIPGALGGGLMGGGGQEGYDMAERSIGAQENYANHLMNMGQEQFAQESPYRANMLNMLQQRAAAPAPVYMPPTPTNYNPFANTYQVGAGGFGGMPAYGGPAPIGMAQVGGYQQPLYGIGQPGQGGSMMTGQALDDHYAARASSQPAGNIFMERGGGYGWNPNNPSQTWDNTYNPATGGMGSGDGLHMGVSYEDPGGHMRYGQGGTINPSVANPWDEIGRQRAVARENIPDSTNADYAEGSNFNADEKATARTGARAGNTHNRVETEDDRRRRRNARTV